MEMGHFHMPKAPLIRHKVPIDADDGSILQAFVNNAA